MRPERRDAYKKKRSKKSYHLPRRLWLKRPFPFICLPFLRFGRGQRRDTYTLYLTDAAPSIFQSPLRLGPFIHATGSKPSRAPARPQTPQTGIRYRTSARPRASLTAAWSRAAWMGYSQGLFRRPTCGHLPFHLSYSRFQFPPFPEGIFYSSPIFRYNTHVRITIYAISIRCPLIRFL